VLLSRAREPPPLAWISSSSMGSVFVVYPGHSRRFSPCPCPERDPSAAAPAACPIEFVHFRPSEVSVRVRNVSGKKIVGLTFNAALADATEHCK
jgi:hypothetical protein